MRRNSREYLDHTNDRTEQSEQRRNRRDGTESFKIALQLMNHVPAGIFDRIFQDHPISIPINQAGSEYLTERRALVQRLNLFLIELVFLDPAPNLAGEVLRDDALLLQRPESLKNDTHGDDRAQDNRQHQPAARFNYFNHKNQNQTENGNIQ